MRDFLTPNMFVPFMYVFYNTDINQLEIPTLIREQNRLTVLDMLYNLGTPDGHEAHSMKVKMFETSNLYPFLEPMRKVFYPLGMATLSTTCGVHKVLSGFASSTDRGTWIHPSF